MNDLVIRIRFQWEGGEAIWAFVSGTERTHGIVAGRVWHEDQFTMDGHVAWGTFNLTCFRFKDTL